MKINVKELEDIRTGKLVIGAKAAPSKTAGECAGDWNHPHFLVMDPFGEIHRNTAITGFACRESKEVPIGDLRDIAAVLRASFCQEVNALCDPPCKW